MIVKRYGIVLERLKEEHLEIVRKNRNTKEIRKRMLFQKRISKNQQKKWFKSIDNKYNYYFLISYRHKYYGLINVKNVSPNTNVGEGGIFIWQELDVEGISISFLASLIFIDSMFNILKTSKESVITVRSNNYNAIMYNKTLGYKEVSQINDVIKMRLTKDDFNRKCDKLVKFLDKKFKLNKRLDIIGEKGDENLSVINEYIKK